jgi:hypothetical protein
MEIQDTAIRAANRLLVICSASHSEVERFVRQAHSPLPKWAELDLAIKEFDKIDLDYVQRFGFDDLREILNDLKEIATTLSDYIKAKEQDKQHPIDLSFIKVALIAHKESMKRFFNRKEENKNGTSNDRPTTA